MTEEDTPFVRTISESLELHGIKCYVAERDLRPGEVLATKIQEAVRNCDCFVALLTKGGSQSAYVNQEIGLAHAFGKSMIPIVEKGVMHVGLKTGVEWIELDRDNPQACFLRLIPRLTSLSATKSVVSVLVLAVLGGLAAWGLKKG